MPITYRQTAGARGAGNANARTISSISGTTGVVTTTAAITGGIAVGSIVEIFGTTTIDNKGFFTCIANNSPTNTQFTLRPKPKTQANSGTLSRCLDTPSYTLGASNVTSILVDSFQTDKAFVQVTGANFKTVGVRRNDRLQIAGSGTTANNGAWIIQEVISESVVMIRSPDLGDLPVNQAASGTVTAFHGRIRIEGVNVRDYSWSKIASTATPKRGPYASKFYRYGSGTITDFVKISTIGDTNAAGVGEVRTLVLLEGVSAVSFYQSGPRDTSFYSINEVVISSGTSGPMGSCDFSEVNPTSWPGKLTVQLGEQLGNRYSVGNGASWIAVNPSLSLTVANSAPTIAASTKTNVNIYGSTLDLTGTAGEVTLGAGNLSGSICRPRVNLGSGIIESLTAYGNSGTSGTGLGVTASGDQANLLLANQTPGSTASITAAAVISGLLLSDTVNSPAFTNSSGGVVEFRDPRQDFELIDVISNATGSAIKTYQFFPRFVSRESGGQSADPIFYLSLRVYEINENDATEIQVINDATNTLGFPESGAVYLKRQELSTAEATTNFSHRLILEGGGYKLVNEIIQLTTPFTDDLPVDRIAPDYEGEFGE